MRLLLVGAFPYPVHQGSQVYFQEQAIALRATGADVELLTYGEPPLPVDVARDSEANGRAPRPCSDPDRWRPLDGFRHHRAPAWTTPRTTRSGPHPKRPLADLGLLFALRRTLEAAESAARPFDAVLAHNAEAALAAVTVRRLRGARAPILLYCVHTLLANELSAYARSLKSAAPDSGTDTTSTRLLERGSHAARAFLRRRVDRVGDRVDRLLARKADGWIALSYSAAHVMRRASTAPGDCIPPPVPDPQLGPPAHSDGLRTEQAAFEIATRHGLEPRRYFLYSGNLDAYQELELLWLAARQLDERSERHIELVVASHDPAVTTLRPVANGIRLLHVSSPREMTALLFAAQATLVTRLAEGGFPIKLANALALGTPPIVFLAREWGLEDGRNALVAKQTSRRPEDLARALADEIERLDDDPILGTRLRRHARLLYESSHLPEEAAARTLALIETIRAAPGA